MITVCPLCPTRKMYPTRVTCECGKISVDDKMTLPPLLRLVPEEFRLAQSLVLCGGNLKALAEKLDISYPTLRKRLDEMVSHLEVEYHRDSKRVDEILDKIERQEILAEEGIKLIREINGEL